MIRPLPFCLTLLLSACGHGSTSIKQESTRLDSLSGQDEAMYEAPYVTDPDKKFITSCPDTLYLGDTLRITFKTPHPKDFAIMTPDDKFFFVVYAYSDARKPSLYDWNAFANMRSIEMIPDQAKANHWNAGVTENKIIFDKTGTYEIRLSENLETDDGTPVEIVSVYYIHEKR